MSRRKNQGAEKSASEPYTISFTASEFEAVKAQLKAEADKAAKAQFEAQEAEAESLFEDCEDEVRLLKNANRDLTEMNLRLKQLLVPFLQSDIEALTYVEANR